MLQLVNVYLQSLVCCTFCHNCKQHILHNRTQTSFFVHLQQVLCEDLQPKQCLLACWRLKLPLESLTPLTPNPHTLLCWEFCAVQLCVWPCGAVMTANQAYRFWSQVWLISRFRCGCQGLCIDTGLFGTDYPPKEDGVCAIATHHQLWMSSIFGLTAQLIQTL